MMGLVKYCIPTLSPPQIVNLQAPATPTNEVVRAGVAASLLLRTAAFDQIRGRGATSEAHDLGLTIAQSVLRLPVDPKPAHGSPNVLAIVLDDTGFAHLGSFGSDIATPHMDRFAAGGLSTAGSTSRRFARRRGRPS
jgi:hypothetical protein